MYIFIWLGPSLFLSLTWCQQALSSALLMYPYTHPIQVGWCSRNAGGVASRTVSASLYNMYVPIIHTMFIADRLHPGSCRHPLSFLRTFIVKMMRHTVSSLHWCFHWPSPNWPSLFVDHRGNSYLIAICMFNVFILYPGTKAYYIWRNKQRSNIWDAMTSEVRSFLKLLINFIVNELFIF